jgi:hypothetical protein
MATLITYQFDSTVKLETAAIFRRRLHQLQSFRMCWIDNQNRCVELPANMVIADYADCASAKAVFELEARRDALLTSLDTAVYAPIGEDFLFEGFRFCKDTRCSFVDEVIHQARVAEPIAKSDDSEEIIA